MATTAHDVAAKLILEQHAAHRSIDKMQLQKLLYLVQAVHLAATGAPAFREPLLAYANGPVVEAVESTYREATAGPTPLPSPLGGHPERLDGAVVSSIRTVLKHFGAWEAPNLERYVKRGNPNPWRQARGDVPERAPSRAVVELEQIEAWITGRGVDPNGTRDVHWQPSDEDLAAARTRAVDARDLGILDATVPAELLAAARQVLAGRPDASSS